MSRSVDDIDLVVLVGDRYILGKNCYTTLALKVVVVEYKFACGLVVAKQFAGEQHFVYECGLAMVNVCYNGNVSDFLHLSSKFSGCKVTTFL